MIAFLSILLWASVAGIVYTYLVYPVLAWVLASTRGRSAATFTRTAVPRVSVVISAFNEESILHEKLENLSALEYPQDRIEFLIGSDGSTDATSSVLSASGLHGLRVFNFPERRGKSAVLNDLLREASGEVVVFSDANTMYARQTILRLVEHFADPAVGGVCGELLLGSSPETAAGKGETSYWEYETKLKKWESAFGSIVGATGGVYAIRRDLFRPLPTSKPVVDDLLTPLGVVRQGFRMIYEPSAVAYEEASGSIGVEFRRRVRIGAQILSGMPEIADLLNPLRGSIALALWSHKILRWAVPVMGVILLVASVLLAPVSAPASMIGAALSLLVGLAALGWVAEFLGIKLGVLGFPFYLVAMNVALAVGYVKCLSGRQRTTWAVDRTVEPGSL
jgi:cellulose synthase/poly-beta-1,6-N-acetylglucosamine synthase-like glycosyltransferase